MSEEHDDHSENHPIEIDSSHHQSDPVASLASNISALIISHEHQDPEPEVHQPSVPEIIAEKIEEVKTSHQEPEEKDPEEPVLNPEPSPVVDLDLDSPRLASEKEPVGARYLELYRSLLSSSQPSQYLPPFLARLKSEGKFHETLLLNYLSNSGDFLNESTIIINNKELRLDDITWTSRSLQISQNQILFVGGNRSSKNCFILDTGNYEVTQIHSLEHGRDLHSVAWVDGKPAAIGGFNEKALYSVEVLEENGWVKADDLNESRYGHSSVYHKLKTWVFGGAKAKGDPVSSIEVFSNGRWTELEVKLPFSKVGLGIFGVGEKILLLGGFTDKKRNSKKVVSFNIESERFENEEELENRMSFSQNLWKLNGESLEGFGFRGQRVSYRVR